MEVTICMLIVQNICVQTFSKLTPLKNQLSNGLKIETWESLNLFEPELEERNPSSDLITDH